MADKDKAAATVVSPKKPVKAKTKNSKPSHPRISEMVAAAIAALKEKGGSSLQAIKKYIAAAYGLDADKLSPFIKKYLKSAVASKELLQVKGKGASGSFKLSAEKKSVAPAAANKFRPGNASPAKKKKPVAPRKGAAKRKPTAAKKPKVEEKQSVKTLVAKKPKTVQAAPELKPAKKLKAAAKRPLASKAKKPAAKKK